MSWDSARTSSVNSAYLWPDGEHLIAGRFERYGAVGAGPVT